MAKMQFVKFTKTQVRGIEQRIKAIQRQLDEERSKGRMASTAAVMNLEADKAFWVLRLRQGGDYVKG